MDGGMTNDGRRDELGFARSAHGARKGNGELEASRARATIRAVLGQRGSSGWMTRGVACRRSVAGMGAGVHSAEQLLCSLACIIFFLSCLRLIHSVTDTKCLPSTYPSPSIWIGNIH